MAELKTVKARRGMVVAPHYLAAQAGLAVLRDGGNAVEAAIATAASLCVVYPHMCGLGGDAFWTIYDPQTGRVRCIDASGLSGSKLPDSGLSAFGLPGSKSVGTGRGQSSATLPQRGPGAMLTCPGAVSGWQKALELAAPWGVPLPLARLLEDAVFHAEHGFAVSASHARMIAEKLDELKDQPGFANQFLHNGLPPVAGSRQTLPALSRTLQRLGLVGLNDFYHGALAKSMAADLAAIGVPLTQEDLAAQQALLREPLAMQLRRAWLYNCPPPSQGVSSLMILGIFNALRSLHKEKILDHSKNFGESFALIHGLVESTKLAFLLRDAHLADPDHMRESVASWLKPDFMAELATKIDPYKAQRWHSPHNPAVGGDTVWFGVIDAAGRAVSCIQSIYFEFGSGVVLPESGITWHNRSLGFSLDPNHSNCLGPRKRPFHTLNPALAIFDDGRVMPYGCMGGEGQPQTQAALFSRYVWGGYDLQQAISAPRWLHGKAWGDADSSLKLESDFTPELARQLRQAGHTVKLVPPQSDMMGHAGALVLHTAGPNQGLIEGATDPRCDGLAACW